MLIVTTQIFIFAIILIAMHSLDFKLWGTKYTPTLVLGSSFFIIFVVCYVYLKLKLKYFELNSFVLPIWLVGLVSFWMGGLFLKLIFPKIKLNALRLQLFKNEFLINKYQLRLLIFLVYPVLLIVAYKVYYILIKFGFNIADEQFQKYLGTGFIAHAILFLTIVSIFLLIFFQKNFYKLHQIVIISGTLIFSILYGVKSWILIPLVAGFIGRLFLSKTTLKFKHILFIIVPFLVFWVVYQISLGLDFSNNKFIFNHMFGYLLSGPIGLSEHLNQGFPIGEKPEYAFTPIINIFRFIIGEKPLDVISNYSLDIPMDINTNVKTFFGTLFIYGGSSFIITSFLLGIILYGYLLTACYSVNTKFSPFIITNYMFMLGLLFMGWFDAYIIHLDFYEVPVLAFILHLFFKIKQL